MKNYYFYKFLQSNVEDIKIWWMEEIVKSKSEDLLLDERNLLFNAYKGRIWENYQVLVITGKSYYDDYKSLDVSLNVKIVPFMEDLINYLKDTDLIVSRAGASTIAEITAIGLPSILVPSPYVTNNHQYKNAKELEDNGACVIVEEKDFSKETIIREIDKIFDDKESGKLSIISSI